MVCGIEPLDCLLHKGAALPNTPINLFCQDLEALVAEEACLVLPWLRKGWHDREVVSGV